MTTTTTRKGWALLLKDDQRAFMTPTLLRTKAHAEKRRKMYIEPALWEAVYCTITTTIETRATRKATP